MGDVSQGATVFIVLLLVSIAIAGSDVPDASLQAEQICWPVYEDAVVCTVYQPRRHLQREPARRPRRHLDRYPPHIIPIPTPTPPPIE
jgi:hypothetical protein